MPTIPVIRRCFTSNISSDTVAEADVEVEGNEQEARNAAGMAGNEYEEGRHEEGRHEEGRHEEGKQTQQHDEDDDDDDDPDPDPCTMRSTTFAGTDLPRTKTIGSVIHDVPPAGQQVALVQFAGPTQLTRSEAHAFRICGVFGTEQEADDHLEDIPKVATCKVPAAKSVTFGAKIGMEDGEKQIAFVEKVMKATRHEVDKSDAEFNVYVARRKTGKETEVLDREEREFMAKQRAEMKATAEALDRVAAKRTKVVDKKLVVRDLKAAHAVPDQTHAVVGILFDPSDKEAVKAQWVVTVWGVFGNVVDAKAYLSDTIQHEQRYHTSFVVKMYKWIYPDEINTPNFQLEVRGVYRFEDQQKMWDGAHNNKSEVAKVIREHEAHKAKLAAAASQVDLDLLAKEIDM